MLASLPKNTRRGLRASHDRRTTRVRHASADRIKEKSPSSRRGASRVWFPGQYYDGETGLNYNYFRDYEPATGRYVESDPIGLSGGISTFSYTGNRPLNSVDPDGQVVIAAPLICVAGGCEGLGTAAAWVAGARGITYFSVKALDDKATQAQERKAYKTRCTQSPPPGLTICQEMKWKLQRNRECRQMRQEFSDKWHGRADSTHAQEIANLDVAIAGLEKAIAKMCGGGRCGK